ncbi:MAG: DUF3943 domain-containing protein [marine benthic group bacterium]|nr:DUF3943 domain-containing protein [Gemmatimonadota bacterium]MCL7961378.1 DUF3943 domain-containing protein [Candidatus Carthagonibacter metallireducens]MCL7977253.1 DUF3943 domain-containing protein [Gemmatimonadota bacterium]
MKPHFSRMMWKILGGLTGSWILAIAVPSPCTAQQVEHTGSPSGDVWDARDTLTAALPGTNTALDSTDPDSAATGPAEDLRWAPPEKSYTRALTGVLIGNTLAVGVNVLWRDEPATNPGSWWDNLQGGWEWDTNPIRVNGFEHPWAGAGYYNFARASGLSFYESLPVTLAGSLMWEWFGEPRPPAINDLVTTTIGGAALGEPMRRVSLVVLDNSATGFDRFWREAAVMVINPGLGLDRLVRGQLWRAGPNLTGHRPKRIVGDMSMGAARLAPADDHPGTNADAGVLRFGVDYGDPFDTESSGAFSSFSGVVELASISAVLTRVGVRGMLTPISSAEEPSDGLLGLFLDFDYRWNGRVGFAEQSIGIGLLSRFGGESWQIDTDISAELLPLVASTDRWATESVQRYYEFGSGLGGRAEARVSNGGHRILMASLDAYWAVTLDGPSSNKLIQIAEVEMRTPPILGLHLGANARLYRQSSSYPDRRTGHESLSSLSVFVGMGG